jgi:hypothetical protein
MLGKVWRFLSKDTNRQILSLIGAGIVAVIAALWAVFVYFVPPSKPASQPPSVTAKRGGVAIGGNVTGSNITVDGATNAGVPKPK